LSKKQKLIKRLQSRPNDFTFDEATTLLSMLGFSIRASGKTSGSRIAFSNKEGDLIRLHKPHPRNELKKYQIDDVITTLKDLELI